MWMSAGIPTFSYPDTAARAFTYMWRYTYNLRELYETPARAEGRARSSTMEIVQTVRDGGRTLLNEYEAKQLLSRYGVRWLKRESRRAKTKLSARASEIGTGTEGLSHAITHKTDVNEESG